MVAHHPRRMKRLKFIPAGQVLVFESRSDALQ